MSPDSSLQKVFPFPVPESPRSAAGLASQLRPTPFPGRRPPPFCTRGPLENPGNLPCGRLRVLCWWEEFLRSTTSGLNGKLAPLCPSPLPPPAPATRGRGARYGCVCVYLCGEGVWREGYRELLDRLGAGIPVTKMGVFSLSSTWKPQLPLQAL